jgi:UDP-N-acetylmuramate--alanine ligase
MEAFDGVDELIVTDVYAASEDEIVGVNSKAFTDEFREKSDIPCRHISGSMTDVAKELYKELKPNDIVIGLGAGTITKLGSELLNLYNEINV